MIATAFILHDIRFSVVTKIMGKALIIKKGQHNQNRAGNLYQSI